jgi:hypothetical protein
MIRRDIFRSLLLWGFLLDVRDTTAQTTLAHEPLRSLKITLNKVEAETFIGKVKEIADEMKFAYGVDRIGPDKKVILFRLWRQDINVSIENALTSLNEYDVFLYNTDERSPVSGDVVQSIGNRVKEKLSEVEGIQVRDAPIIRY